MTTPLLNLAGRLSANMPITPNQVSLVGFGAGVLAFLAISLEYYLLGMVFILANRVLDAIDGAVARKKGVTDYGGYLDIVLDFLFYSSVPLAFGISNPEYALPAAVLIFSFVGTGSSFLAYAVICAKRQITDETRGRKSFYYMGGLTEATETTIFFVAFCIFPTSFPLLAYIFSALCFVTYSVRIYAAYERFGA